MTYQPNYINEDAMKEWIGLIVFATVLLGGAALFGWYSAGVQQQVYEREGIHMTQWECFMGAKPAELKIK